MKSKTFALALPEALPTPIILPVLAFTIPLLVSGPQILTGSLVNCLLFFAADYSSRKIRIPMAVGPSIGALLNGLIFGSFTPYLAYFLPFIWIGNIILMQIFLILKNHGSAKRIIFSSTLKSVFLFTIAFAFYRLGFVPRIFLTAMGVFQLATALLGGILYSIFTRYAPLTWQVNKGAVQSAKIQQK